LQDSRLQASGNFQGGSAIGAGVCARKSGMAPIITGHLSGFIRVSAGSSDDARTLFARVCCTQIEIRKIDCGCQFDRSPCIEGAL